MKKVSVELSGDFKSELDIILDRVLKRPTYLMWKTIDASPGCVTLSCSSFCEVDAKHLSGMIDGFPKWVWMLTHDLSDLGQFVIKIYCRNEHYEHC